MAACACRHAVDMFSLGVTLLECSTKYRIDSIECRKSLREGIVTFPFALPFRRFMTAFPGVIPDYALENSSQAWQRMLRLLVSLDPHKRYD